MLKFFELFEHKMQRRSKKIRAYASFPPPPLFERTEIMKNKKQFKLSQKTKY